LSGAFESISALAKVPCVDGETGGVAVNVPAKAIGPAPPEANVLAKPEPPYANVPE
jgi:hypothetical protein